MADYEVRLVPVSDDWLVVLSQDRLDRCSRAEGADLIRESVRLGGISIDSAAAWVSRTSGPYPFENWVGDYLHVLLSSGGPYSATSTTGDPEALRLWADFGPSGRARLRRGDTISLSDLEPEAKTQISKLVYWLGCLDSDAVDPTDRLPNGISDGTVNLTVTEMPVFAAWSSKVGPAVSPHPLDSKTFGKFLAVGNSWSEVPAETYRAYDRYQMGLHRSYKLHFLIRPGGAPMTLQLSETFFDPSDEPMDRLPDAVRAEVDTARRTAMAAPPDTSTKGSIPPR
jgi:hypothetical protein